MPQNIDSRVILFFSISYLAYHIDIISENMIQSCLSA